MEYIERPKGKRARSESAVDEDEPPYKYQDVGYYSDDDARDQLLAQRTDSAIADYHARALLPAGMEPTVYPKQASGKKRKKKSKSKSKSYSSYRSSRPYYAMSAMSPYSLPYQVSGVLGSSLQYPMMSPMGTQMMARNPLSNCDVHHCACCVYRKY